MKTTNLKEKGTGEGSNKSAITQKCNLLSKVPSKLLTSTVTHNFDRGSQKFKKNCRNFKAQERHPLSKYGVKKYIS
jgi:hypothetical protein